MDGMRPGARLTQGVVTDTHHPAASISRRVASLARGGGRVVVEAARGGGEAGEHVRLRSDHQITLNDIALHCIALHCIALHCIALHYTHYTTLHYTHY